MVFTEHFVRKLFVEGVKRLLVVNIPQFADHLTAVVFKLVICVNTEKHVGDGAMWHWHVVRGNFDSWPQNLLSLSHNISKFCCRAVPKVTFPFLNVVLKMVWKVSYGVKKCGPVEQEWFFDYRGESRV